MRKIFVLGIILTGFIYAMPVLAQRVEGGGKPDRTQDVLSVHAENPSMSANGGQDVKITVQVDGEAREMLLEDYVAGVVAAEISPSFPEEALKAQAVAARTYAAYKQRTGRPEAHPDADVCDDYHHCAAYIDLAAEASGRWGSEAETCENAILSAVRATAGEVVTYEGEPIIAVFCAASGEKTESSADVWGSEVPYLQTVDSPGGEACPKYKGEVRFTAKEFRRKYKGAALCGFDGSAGNVVQGKYAHRCRRRQNRAAWRRAGDRGGFARNARSELDQFYHQSGCGQHHIPDHRILGTAWGWNAVWGEVPRRAGQRLSGNPDPLLYRTAVEPWAGN